MKWSAGFRFFIVGVLALLMFIPLFFVGSIIDSRSDYSRSTVNSIESEWGGAQTINGPQLVIPVEGPVKRNEQREIVDPETNRVRTEVYEVTEQGRKNSIFVYPETFDVTLNTTSEERRRGIFNVPVYRADMDMAFAFEIPTGSLRLEEGEVILWDQAYLKLSVSSNRALRGKAELLVDGKPVPLEPLARSNNSSGGIVANIGDPRQLNDFSLALGFNGANRLLIAPVGRTNQIAMTSDWPHPSFTGAFLPDGSEISETGFSANWTIPHLARSLPQVSRSNYASTAQSEAFGVRYFQPNDFYQKAYRAARYGILFIALTFLTVLLIEGRTGKPTHPVQYILIGLAQSIFVLLMVSFAEQIGFGLAYGLASAATIGLLTMFGFVALRLGNRTYVLSGMLIVLYSVLYLILRSADYALLAGATLSFVALAGTMFATRNEDWYGPPKTGESGGWFGRKSKPAKVVETTQKEN
ncbi:cell envelope integrity protein CreD [Parasulfitobacter algicola]|uniref:Cell envelope integrity protein CreD n=1 Tax=Parasulfitobacter algicola TaxID=2614809 RepID=A0ABX2IMI1_9RHOB|nr:cell envelope integrity protein CreD [Sulfitobacter algicola]NSX53186.1 cell envelope integrity protein CreD [Sulfitobacter algicola]